MTTNVVVGHDSLVCRSGVPELPYGIYAHSLVALYSPGVDPSVHWSPSPLSAAAARELS